MTEKPSGSEGIPDSASWGEIEYHLGKLSMMGIIDPDESAAIIESKDSEKAFKLLLRGVVERKPTKEEIPDLKEVINFLAKVSLLNLKSNSKDYE